MVKREEHATPNGLPAVPVSGPVRRMVALYDYDPQELSPNVDSEVWKYQNDVNLGLDFYHSWCNSMKSSTNKFWTGFGKVSECNFGEGETQVVGLLVHICVCVGG